MMLRPLIAPTASLAANAVRHAPFNLPLAFTLRGGAAAAAFDMGLAKTRLDGLAYSTVSTLLMNTALVLFTSTPKKFGVVPEDSDDKKTVQFDNKLKLLFGLCMSICVALGTYTTTIYALLAIYSKTALGMNLQSQFLEFFDRSAFFRLWGFRSFIGTILTYNLGWIISVILTYDDDTRWWMAMPAIVVGVIGLIHYRGIVKIASNMLYS